MNYLFYKCYFGPLDFTLKSTNKKKELLALKKIPGFFIDCSKKTRLEFIIKLIFGKVDLHHVLGLNFNEEANRVLRIPPSNIHVLGIISSLIVLIIGTRCGRIFIIKNFFKFLQFHPNIIRSHFGLFISIKSIFFSTKFALLYYLMPTYIYEIVYKIANPLSHLRTDTWNLFRWQPE